MTYRPCWGSFASRPLKMGRGQYKSHSEVTATANSMSKACIGASPKGRQPAGAPSPSLPISFSAPTLSLYSPTKTPDHLPDPPGQPICTHHVRRRLVLPDLDASLLELADIATLH